MRLDFVPGFAAGDLDEPDDAIGSAPRDQRTVLQPHESQRVRRALARDSEPR